MILSRRNFSEFPSWSWWLFNGKPQMGELWFHSIHTREAAWIAYIKAKAGSYIITHLLKFNIGFIVIFWTSFSFENGN